MHQRLLEKRHSAHRFKQAFAEVTPSNPGLDSTVLDVAEAALVEIERWLREEGKSAIVIATETGRTLKAAINSLCKLY